MQKRAALIIVAFLLGTIFSAGVSFDTLEDNSIIYNSGITNSSGQMLQLIVTEMLEVIHHLQ